MKLLVQRGTAMSTKSSIVTKAHFDYIAGHTAGDDEFLNALKEEAVRAGIPPIHIAPEQASFMQILLKLSGAREVVEVGTLAGYSAIAMARALPRGGKVRTIEIEPRYADFAQSWVAQSDVADRIEIHVGDARDVLAGFETASAEAAFLDADKSNYPHYLEECMRIVHRGGLIMADNAFAFGQLLDAEPADPDVPAVRAFNDAVPRVEHLHSVIVPLGDGLWVGVKER